MQLLDYLRSNALMRRKLRASVDDAMTDRTGGSGGELGEPLDRFAQRFVLRGGRKGFGAEALTVCVAHRERPAAAPDAIGKTIEEQMLLPFALHIETELEGGRSCVDDENRCIGHDGFLGFDCMGPHRLDYDARSLHV
jgi:hypothetical protein